MTVQERPIEWVGMIPLVNKRSGLGDQNATACLSDFVDGGRDIFILLAYTDQEFVGQAIIFEEGAYPLSFANQISKYI